jgi:hypothetical protein
VKIFPYLHDTRLAHWLGGPGCEMDHSDVGTSMWKSPGLRNDLKWIVSSTVLYCKETNKDVWLFPAICSSIFLEGFQLSEKSLRRKPPGSILLIIAVMSFKSEKVASSW